MSRALAIVVCVGLIGCAAAAPPPPVAVVPAAAVTPGAAVRSGAPGESAVPARAPSSGPVAPTPAQDPAPPAKPPPAAAQKPVSVAAPKPAPAPSLTSDALVAEILASGGSAALKTVLAAPQQYRFQVLFGAVTTGATPALERRGYRTDAEYYFPASSMKVPIALALYDRLSALRASGHRGLTRDATVRIHPSTGAGDPYTTTLARETWRALIVSDNFSANRLLGFVGHAELHDVLWGLGLASSRVHSGFATGDDIGDAEDSPRIEIVGAAGAAGDELPARKSTKVLPATDATGLQIGKASIVDGRRVEAPLSFADKNAIRLRELQDVLVRILRPDLLPAGAKADPASKEDLAYLREALGTLPSRSGLAGFDRNVVADYMLSPFLRGIERVRARGKFEIFSKVGQAFGFLVANAYVVDVATGKAFFLTASVFANPDDVMNDDKYGYDATSFPALADVGELFARRVFDAPPR